MDVRVNEFKRVMGNYPTGVTIVTTVDDNAVPIGLTVNSFASVSLDPMLILWSIDKRVSTYDHVIKANRFAVHILASNQGDLASLFATKGVDRFGKAVWHWSKLNLPIITNVAGILQCETFKTIEAGDHTIMIGKVIDIIDAGKAPLIYHKRNFGPIPNEFYKA